MVMNLLYVRNLFETKGFPVFVLELVYEGCTPDIQGSLRVSTKSYLFHKENLCRVLETKIPDSYTKLAFIDADVVFSDASWYEKTSELLDTYDVVQPYEQCYWWDITYTKTFMTRKTAVLQSGPEWDFDYHPGFAWCFRRDWYRNVGFFDVAVSGGGDILSAAAWLSIDIPDTFHNLPRLMREEYRKFCQHEKPRISYTKEIQLYHLFHGPRDKRQYNIRNEPLQIDDLLWNQLEYTKEGILEWKDLQRWNPFYFKYFEGRDDDLVQQQISYNIHPTIANIIAPNI